MAVVMIMMTVPMRVVMVMVVMMMAVLMFMMVVACFGNGYRAIGLAAAASGTHGVWG